jgi:hypothetical protein
VRQYLERHADPARVEMVWLEGEQHGGMLVKSDRLRDVARLVRTACGLVGA